MAYIAIFSIFAITTLIYLANKILPFRICPICAGVSATWLYMFGAKILGLPIDNTILALLVGGTAVGIAYQLEKYLPQNCSPLLFKTVAISLGFVIGYGIVTLQFGIVIIPLLTYAVLVAWIFLLKASKAKKETKASVEMLTKEMKNCC